MQLNQAKSTKSAPLWRILITSLLLSNLAGCASFDLFGSKIKPIEVVSKPLEKTPLDITPPEPLSIKPIEWIVVTPENVDEVFAKLKDEGKDVVILAMTSDGYQRLAITMADIRNFVNTQRNIIIQYKQYYEPKDEKK
jgi:hypothetical protein